jgi:sulfatase modifying factor 1
MRRTHFFPLAPLAAAGLSLALGAHAGPRATPPGASAPSASSAKKPPPPAPLGPSQAPPGHARKGAKRRSHGATSSAAHPTLAAVMHAGGEYDVAEGTLSQVVAGAVCPPEMANVDDRFCIDRWEGSLVEVLADGRELPWPPFGPVDDARRLRAVSVPNVYPQAYISGAQAARSCAAAGKRLCAPVEWRKACTGPQSVPFGYGAQRVPGRCNDAGQSPMLRLYPQVAVSWSGVGMTEMNDPRLNQLDATLAPTGSHDQCTNDYGVFDMVGNLHEWTNDPNGTFQGGYYLDTHRNGDGCAYRTVAHEFTYHDYSTGFRCCASPVSP